MSRTRRDFLKASLGASTLVSLGATVPRFLSRSAMAAAPHRDRDDTILIVVQMAGGNDGLNTIVPYEDDEYARNRPTLRQPADKLHKINSLLGFHPQMEKFSRMMKEGHLSVVQGVGYPNPDGDHFRSMQNWLTAMPGQVECQTGWLGRTLDHVLAPDDPSVPAAFVGQIELPFSLNAHRTIVPTVRSLDEYRLATMSGKAKRADQGAQPESTNGDNGLLDFVRRATLAAQVDSRRIAAVADEMAPGRAAKYPQIPLAAMFRTVAQLIRADLGIRIFYTELGGNGPGGFDNHANQRGNHGALLYQLSESLAALVDDLRRDRLLDRVLLMTFSEFGRTVKENGRRGTGHGSAAPVFLAGGKLKGGLIGEHPNLTELENGGQKHHTDFRQLYATVLEQWLGFDSRPALGGQFEPVDVLRS